MSRNVKWAIVVFVVSALGAGAIYMISKKTASAAIKGKYSQADFIGLTRVDMISQLPLRDYSKMSDAEIRTELVNYKNLTS